VIALDSIDPNLGKNPGGSAKDRSAYSMIKNALETGALKHGGTVVESSSGNMAIGLAQACCRLGLRFISVVDVKTTQNNKEILRAYGAEVITVSEPDLATGEFLPARLACVQHLLRVIPDSFWPNQYASEHNARAHRQTMHEVVEALDGQVDYLFCPTSTCGTIRGCYEYARYHRLEVRLVAVDAVGSIIFGGQVRPRLLPGHGSAVRPGLADGLQVDRVVYVDDADCAAGCRHLVRTEGILAGASSGGAIAAIAKIQMELPPQSNCVVILHDRGERYIDTVYSDDWLRQHFGSIPTIDHYAELTAR
jgi:N-(2-amino-2-carboxyethyl)-L-glutamate synthase